MSRDLSPEEDAISDWLMDEEPDFTRATLRLLEELKPHLVELPEPFAELVEYIEDSQPEEG